MSSIAWRGSLASGAVVRRGRLRSLDHEVRSQPLGGVACGGSRRPSDSDRVHVVLDNGSAGQTAGPASRQPSDRLLPQPLRVFRDLAICPSQEGPPRLPHDPSLRPFPARSDRRCGDGRRLLRDDPVAAHGFDGDQFYRTSLHDPDRHLLAGRKGEVAARPRHPCRVYRRSRDGSARQRSARQSRHGRAVRRFSRSALDDALEAPVDDRGGPDDPRLFQPIRLGTDRAPGLFCMALNKQRRSRDARP